MRVTQMSVLLLPLLLFVSGASGQAVTIGTDVYAGGEGASRIASAPRSLFAAGPAVRVDSPIGRDAHLAGFSVHASGATGGDLYAMGGDVTLDGAVGGDLTAGGFSLSVGPGASVEGNARLAGGSVSIAAPVRGTLVASGGAVTLDAPVGGDAWIAADHLAFGPAARIAGQLHLAAPDEVQVPGAVVPADRITRRPMSEAGRFDPGREWRRDWMLAHHEEWGIPGALGLSLAAVLTLLFLLAAGAAFLASAPVLVERLRRQASLRPWRALLLGALGLSALVGAIPVAAASLIGLPLVPIAILALILLWTLGYLLGLHVAAQAVLAGLRGHAAPAGFGWSVLGLALALLLAALLNFVPLLGWMANMLLGILGLGAMALVLAERLAPPPREVP